MAEPAAVLLFSLAVLLPRLSVPAGYVFDEGIYVPSAIGTMLRLATFEDSHPPLGKMLIAVGIAIFGDKPLGWRIMSVLAGALSVMLVFLITKELAGRGAAWVAAILTLTNGLLFVLSRTAALDIFAIVFALAGALAWMRERVWLGSALFGLSLACKWIILIPLALLIVLMLLALPRLAAKIAVGTAAGYLAAYGVLALWFRSAPVLLSILGQQFAVVTGHVSHVGPPGQVSRWFTWPVTLSPMAFYLDNRSQIMLIGNPVVMFCGLVAIVAALWRRNNVSAVVLACLWAALWLQYAVMPLQSTFYHYYGAPAMLLGPIIVMTVQSNRWRWTLAGLSCWSFCWMYPGISAWS